MRGSLIQKRGRATHFIMALTDISDRIGHEQRITQAILEATEQERAYISRELHDGLTQNLSIASMNLKNLAYDVAGVAQAPRYLKASQYLSIAIDQSRSVAHQLMPKAIEDLGLVPATEELTDEIQAATQADITFNYGQQVALPPSQALHLYRIVQEALHNIQKHAQATHIVIDLVVRQDTVRLAVSDNGCGFQVGDKLQTGVGLRTMQSRASQLGGTLHIHSTHASGTTIEVLIPLTPSTPQT
ncbi:MAG: hypothetical protein OHK0039_34890 [Bacteroidia bacterium]